MRGCGGIAQVPRSTYPGGVFLSVEAATIPQKKKVGFRLSFHPPPDGGGFHILPRYCRPRRDKDGILGLRDSEGRAATVRLLATVFGREGCTANLKEGHWGAASDLISRFTCKFVGGADLKKDHRGGRGRRDWRGRLEGVNVDITPQTDIMAMGLGPNHMGGRTMGGMFVNCFGNYKGSGAGSDTLRLGTEAGYRQSVESGYSWSISVMTTFPTAILRLLAPKLHRTNWVDIRGSGEPVNAAGSL
ncbi:hypothetical protein Tco_0938544 [Tanacetum coccineum]|uniref:Uncharacterized protein n=1 Tax=Tanacetum coccineum TaxID=301880 RepID=A0ABQ5DPG4_9ASTR